MGWGFSSVCQFLVISGEVKIMSVDTFIYWLQLLCCLSWERFSQQWHLSAFHRILCKHLESLSQRGAMLLLLQPWENLPTSFRSPGTWLSVVFFSSHLYLWSMSSFRMQEYLGQLRSHNRFTAWESSLKEPTAKSPYLLQRQRKSCLWFLWSQGSASSQNITPRSALLCWSTGKAKFMCMFSLGMCMIVQPEGWGVLYIWVW